MGENQRKQNAPTLFSHIWITYMLKLKCDFIKFKQDVATRRINKIDFQDQEQNLGTQEKCP